MNLKPKGEGAKGGFLRAMSRSRKQGYCHRDRRIYPWARCHLRIETGRSHLQQYPRGRGREGERSFFR